MKKINFFFVVIIATLVLLSAASLAWAQTIRKTLELPEFKSISVNSGYTIILKQSNKQEVIAETLPEIWELTTVKVENGVLMVNMERKPESPNKSIWAKIDDIKLKTPMKLFVSVRNITELQVNGSGKISSDNSLSSEYLNLSVSGSGEMELDIKGNTLKTEISGSGNIRLKGYANSNEISLAGSGNIHAFECEVENTKVKITGSGSCEINVSGNLEAIISGSGTVKHKGNTKNVTKKVLGSGSVERSY